ncbi:lipoprotein [Cellulosilyticum sp. I15G10I2]|uniref:lipoprotein n=1 Tax=Cellulosilyticum sp. I15G10I2 TaxID=1892843 RepID=UPI00085CD862|nr:lipoprotein [Cellulosilyticum sp. I15G10I2]
MKKIVIALLVMLVLSGCSQNKEKELAKEIITKMITYSTYTQTDKNEDNLPIILEAYFSDEGYKQFVAGKTGYIYPEYLRLTKASDTEKIKFKKIEMSKQKKGFRLTCHVEYSIVYNNKKIKMQDTLTLSFDEKKQVTEVLILNTSDIIHKMFLERRIM